MLSTGMACESNCTLQNCIKKKKPATLKGTLIEIRGIEEGPVQILGI